MAIPNFDGAIKEKPDLIPLMKDEVARAKTKRIESIDFLRGVVMIIMALIALLFPICRWYMNDKLSNRKFWWLSYL